MRVRAVGMWTAIVAGGLMAGGAVLAQNTPAPIPKNPISTKPEGVGQNCSYSGSRSSDGKAAQSSTCNPSADANAAQRFPYPGDTSNPAVPQTSTDAPQPANAPHDKQAGSTSQRFPFPGEDPKAAPVNAPPSPLQDAGSSGTSSSSSSAGGDPVADAPAGDAPDNLPAPKRARRKLPPVARQTPDEREQEDVKVAGFYQNDGNYRAAYLRAKDAVSLDDSDPEAHFALAEAARKLGKLDEAEKNYKRCLDLDPLPKVKKDSQKALKEMAGS